MWQGRKSQNTVCFWDNSYCGQLWIKYCVLGSSVQRQGSWGIYLLAAISPLLRGALGALNARYFQVSPTWKLLGALDRTLRRRREETVRGHWIPVVQCSQQAGTIHNSHEIMAETTVCLRGCDPGHQKCLLWTLGHLGSNPIFTHLSFNSNTLHILK